MRRAGRMARKRCLDFDSWLPGHCYLVCWHGTCCSHRDMPWHVTTCFCQWGRTTFLSTTDVSVNWIMHFFLISLSSAYCLYLRRDLICGFKHINANTQGRSAFTMWYLSNVTFSWNILGPDLKLEKMWYKTKGIIIFHNWKDICNCWCQWSR